MSTVEATTDRPAAAVVLPRRAGSLALFSLTMFVSATLLFLIQPMFAKLVLPRLGGSPSVWTAVVLFFQATLLLGYAYVHVLTRYLNIRRQLIVHIVVVLAPLPLLPFAIPADWAPAGNPVLALLALFAATVGAPYFVVATSAPLLQRWLAGTTHPDANDPYFLYAASNVGSLLGLLVYPVVLEHALGLPHQAETWAVGYVALLALVLGCAAWRWRAPNRSASRVHVAAGEAVTWGRRLRWLVLALVPVILMLGLTAKFTSDIAPIPLLWTVPLALYLVTFIVAFSTLFERGLAQVAPWAFVVVALLLIGPAGLSRRDPLWLVASLHVASFVLAALVCHSRAARDRPPPQHLTEFYVWLALGGAAGGALNTIVAPAAFDTLAEYPLALVAAFACLPLKRKEGTGADPADRRRDVLHPLILMLALFCALSFTFGRHATATTVIGGAAAAACLWFALRRRPLRLTLAVAALLLTASFIADRRSDVIFRDRSFFGIHQVLSVDGGRVHVLVHGTTVHGAQWQDSRRLEPLTYYSRGGPLGQLVAGLPDRDLLRRTAVVGLGTGSVACYARSGESWTFFEIDASVVAMARDPRQFTFLRDCPGRYPVVLGDARLSLQADSGPRYGLVVLDAFTSDAIPVHLMTREAVELYVRRLAPGGVLAFHISNRYLDLEPVLGRLAEVGGLACVDRVGSALPNTTIRASSHWLVMARRSEDLGAAAAWSRCRTDSAPLWTDDYSNVLRRFHL